MTRCEQMNHYTRNGLMTIAALVKLYVDPEYQDLFLVRLEQIEKALERCDCECKDMDITDSAAL